MFLDPIFTLAQDLDLIGLISLIGLIQCVIVLTLILLKDADIGQSGPMVAFFAVLGLSFGLPATLHPQFAFGEVVTIWLAQAWIPTLSYLLILQAAIGRLPEARHFAVLALPMIGAPAVLVLVAGSEGCGGVMLCAETVTLLRVFGVPLGAFILLLLWLHRGLLTPLREGKKPRNRYWVVLTLIVFNVLNLGVDIPRAVGIVGPGEATLIRAVLGLSLAYLVTTLMFRITPKQLVLLSGLPILRRNIELTAEELAVADRIKELMTFDKPYHISTFSRADLALEFNLSEIVISRVINGAFGKSFRRFVNEYRVEEAKRWLRRGNRQVTKIAVNVGFSRHTSFNRVFKQIAGQSPTKYRAALAAAGNSETTDEQPDALGGSVRERAMLYPSRNPEEGNHRLSSGGFDMTDDETAAIERLIRNLMRAPKHRRRTTTHEILKHLSEQGDAEAAAALSVLTGPERIQLSRDLKDALTWDNWIMSETGKFRPTDKSQYHDADELVEAYIEALPAKGEKYVDELIANGKLESYEKDSKTYYRRVGTGGESDEAR